MATAEQGEHKLLTKLCELMECNIQVLYWCQLDKAKLTGMCQSINKGGDIWQRCVASTGHFYTSCSLYAYLDMYICYDPIHNL